MAGALTVAKRLIDATNAHDLEAMLACFQPDYRSEQPAHPARTFEGIDQVRKNWSTLMEAVPDIRWEVLRSAETADEAWLEARLTGTQEDGTTLDEIGVVILGVEQDKIAWGRLYVKEIEADGGDIDATVSEMAGRDAPGESAAR
ncbi:MAG: nuclear transport factor 2 family protein [Gaiellaceae bacterium]